MCAKFLKIKPSSDKKWHKKLKTKLKQEFAL